MPLQANQKKVGRVRNVRGNRPATTYDSVHASPGPAMMGLLKNMVSTAALVPCTRVINTFHSSIHAAFLSIAARSTHEMRCEP